MSTSPKTSGQPPTARPAFPAHIELAGRIAPDLVEYVHHKIDVVLGHTGRAALSAHVRIVRHEDPARERPVEARASVGLAGAVVHAHADADTARAAVDLLLDRLDHRISKISRTRRGDRSTPAVAAAKAAVGEPGGPPATPVDGSDAPPDAAAQAPDAPPEATVDRPDAPPEAAADEPDAPPTAG